MVKRDKSKISQISLVTIVLIVLIAIILIAIVWNVVIPLLGERSQEIQFSRFTVDLKIKGAILYENRVSVVIVSRGAGEEKLDGLKFVFYDEDGNSATRDGSSIEALETRNYSFAAIPEVGRITRVGVAPIVNGNLGVVVESESDSTLRVPARVVSWWRFEDLTDIVGGNLCVVMEGGIENGVLNGRVNCNTEGINFGEQMAISFWVNGNDNELIISKGENNQISIQDSKLKIHFLLEDRSSDVDLTEGWNHIVVSLSRAFLAIYVNTEVKTFSPNYFEPNSNQLIINGQVDEVMFFDAPITNVEGIYNTQKKI